VPLPPLPSDSQPAAPANEPAAEQSQAQSQQQNSAQF
jgi:hypothetical protein